MTGNNKIWRASLAGLASVAMLATMGVSAANAGTLDPNAPDQNTQFNVKVYAADDPAAASPLWSGAFKYGQTADLTQVANPYSSKTDGKILTGYSYDKDGKNPVSDGFVAIKGDTKVYAQYASAYTVNFDVDNDGKYESTEPQLEVKAGSSIDAAAYTASGAEAAAKAEADNKGLVFAGWKQTYATDAQDLYTDGAITKNVTLYPVYEKYGNAWGISYQQNLSEVVFHVSNSTVYETLYTLANRPFPAFRAPEYPTYGVNQWSADKDNKSAYDFTANVKNSNENYGEADLTLYGFGDFGAKNWTVKYDFKGADPTIYPSDKVNVAEGSKIAEPNDPALWGAQFTGWYTEDGSKVDFNTPVEKIQGAKAETRTLTVHAGWDTKNIKQVTYDYNYFYGSWATPATGAYAFKGQAVDFVTAGSKINQPTGVEDYFKTAEQSDHNDGSYTTRTVKGWASVVDGAPITVVKANDVEVYAQWSSAESLKLNGNGGFFANGTNYAYVTKTDGQSWKDVVVTPTRDGYNFAGWAEAKGYGFVNLAAGKYYDASGAHDLEDGTELVAVWVPASVQSVKALHDRFDLSGVNKDADVKTVVDAGYTEASAKAYVDAWYNLQDEYAAAFFDNTTTQAQIDAYNALLPKYQAAEALLVKAGTPVEPTVEKVPVYRLYNKYITTGSNHLFTTDKGEYDSLVAKGWQGEGEVFQATSDKSQVPVYRLYNKYDGSHHYTKDVAERDNLVSLGWTYEFIGFYAPSDGDATLYRLYNQYNGEHLFTTDKAENDKLVALGWTAEESGLKVYSAAK